MKASFKRSLLLLAIAAGAFVSSSNRARGQAPACDEANPDVHDAVLDVRVTFASGSYRYDYSVRNPTYSTGCVDGASIETTGSDPQPTVGPGIITFPDERQQYAHMPGTYTINNIPQCKGGLGGTGFWWQCNDGVVEPLLDPAHPQFFEPPLIAPGQTLPVFSIVSPGPPGPRPYDVTPRYEVPDDQADILKLGRLTVNATTVGPFDPAATEFAFFPGDGNFGAESGLANTFLSYSNPLAIPIALRASETNFPLAVRYGSAIVPATFAATLNGADVSCLFHPAAAFIEAPTMALHAGENSLVLSIRGTGNGTQQTDTDHLVFNVAAAPVPTPIPTPFAPCGNRPPVCTGAHATPASLWPPDHRLGPISIDGVTDPDGDRTAIVASAVRQDEPAREPGNGAGNTSPDATLAPLAVRAERNGNPTTPGDGRVYHVSFMASDGRGGSCTGEVKVCVPHDRAGANCVDGGALFDSLAR